MCDPFPDIAKQASQVRTQEQTTQGFGGNVC